MSAFSLPTQRCFRNSAVRRIHEILFSAYAEVFLNLGARLMISQPFLCLRRGVS